MLPFVNERKKEYIYVFAYTYIKNLWKPHEKVDTLLILSHFESCECILTKHKLKFF